MRGRRWVVTDNEDKNFEPRVSRDPWWCPRCDDVRWESGYLCPQCGKPGKFDESRYVACPDRQCPFCGAWCRSADYREGVCPGCSREFDWDEGTRWYLTPADYRTLSDAPKLREELQYAFDKIDVWISWQRGDPPPGCEEWIHRVRDLLQPKRNDSERSRSNGR